MTPEVLTLFILNILFLLFASIAFILAFKIHRFYDKSATDIRQYKLEKESYLSATIIKYIFAIKIPLFIFFIFTLEKISIILPGAMCSAGVVNATEYGVYLLILKLLNLYLFAYWVLLNAQDMKSETQPYIKLKFQLFIPLYIFLVIEVMLEATMFLSIDIKDVVDCCGVVFSSSDGSYIAEVIGAPAYIQTSLFYTVFAMMNYAYYREKKGLFSILNVLFLLVSLTTLIGFFGTYIYEMPTHHCPFCFLAKDYNYIGYILYISLFTGTLFGSVLGLIKFEKKQQTRYFRLSMLFNWAYLLIISAYVWLYYLNNSVWL